MKRKQAGACIQMYNLFEEVHFLILIYISNILKHQIKKWHDEYILVLKNAISTISDY
jgi:hypothetical protein